MHISYSLPGRLFGSQPVVRVCNFLQAVASTYYPTDRLQLELSDLGSSGAIRRGSSPPFRMICKKKNEVLLSGIDPRLVGSW